MTQRCRGWYALAISLLVVGPALGQDVEDRDRWVGGEDLWTNVDAWVDSTDSPSGAPSPVSADRWALVQDGNVIVDGDIGTSGLTLNGGAVQINNGASLTIDLIDDAFSVGQTEISGNGTLRLLGDAKFTALGANNRGTIEFGSPAASVETKGDFTTSGTLRLNITGDGTSSIKVGGHALIGGLISPVFDGVSPAFGDSFEFVNGAQSVALDDALVGLPSTVVLDRGLAARVEFNDSGAALAIGNVPVVQVDRVDGTVKILNVVGGDIAMTGYTIGSKLGLLDDSGFKPVGTAGFIAPNPLTTSLSELSLENQLTLPVGAEVNIGKAYNGGATHPNDEDVSFQYSTPNGRILNGLVEYVGPANDLVANVNPATGEVSLYHLSSHLDPIEVTGYDIVSASGSLNVEAWDSFLDSGLAGDGWVKANPQATSLSELNLTSSKVFTNGTVISLGDIFKTDGPRDLVIEYSTVDSVRSATVEYGDVPVSATLCDPNTLGDIDGNGVVQFPDFLILADNFGSAATDHTTGDVNCNGVVDFPDFLILAQNFGQPVAAAASVPEPSSAVLLSLGGFLLLGRRQRQNWHQLY